MIFRCIKEHTPSEEEESWPPQGDNNAEFWTYSGPENKPQGYGFAANWWSKNNWTTRTFNSSGVLQSRTNDLPDNTTIIKFFGSNYWVATDDGYIAKYSAAFVKDWEYYLGGEVNDFIIDSAQYCYVASDRGAVEVDDDGDRACVRKLDSAGGKIWDYDLGDGIHAFKIVNDGTYIYIMHLGPTIKKLNSSGTLQWSWTSPRGVYSIGINTNGAVVLGG